MTIGLTHYLSVAAILFTIGVFGIFVNRKNIIVILMSVELILLAASASASRLFVKSFVRMTDNPGREDAWPGLSV